MTSSKRLSWKIALFSVVMAFALMYNGNAYGQSTANYSFTFSNTGSLVDMSSGTTSMLAPNTYHDDVASALTDIGFTFTLMGVNYTQFSINSNGQMRLGPTVIGGVAQSPASGVALLAPMGGDNSIKTSGKVHYKVIGTAPSRQLVVEWNDLRIPYANNDSIGSLVQAILNEGTGVFEYRYGRVRNVGSALTRSIFFSSSNTANTVKTITIAATPIAIDSSGARPNSFPANSDIANLSSFADGSRWVYTFTPPAGGTPAAPINLTFTNVGRTSMTVNWTDNSTNESWFTVQRATSIMGPYSVIGTVASTTSGTTGTAYFMNQTGLTPGTTYYFRISASHEGAASTDLEGNQSTDAVSAFSGAYTINPNAPNAGTNFTTWAEAFSSLNSMGLAGPTTFTVTGTASTVTFVEGNLTLGGPYTNGVGPKILSTLSSANTLTFVAEAGKTINMSGAGTGTADFVFRLMGVDYVTFDGINILDTATTDTRRFEWGYIINNASNTDGATYNTIKNFSVTLNKANATNSAAVTITNGTTLISTTIGVAGTYASRANYNTIHNFTIQNCRRGISTSGLGYPALDEGNVISGPAFTSAAGGVWTGGSRITNWGSNVSGTDWGISVDGQKDMKIFNIQIDSGSTTTAANALSGIHFGTAATTGVGADNIEIFNNVIRQIANNGTSATGGVCGIRSSVGAIHNVKIYNNVIADLRNTTTTGANALIAFDFNGPTAGSRLEFYNNSVNIVGAMGAGGVAKGARFGVATIALTFKNNAISVTGGGSTGGAILLDFGSTAPTLLDMSNNVYNVGTTSSTRRVAVYNSANRQNLIDWQSNMATPSNGVDMGSAYGVPGFNGLIDLTIGTGGNLVNNSGMPIGFITTDILGVPRGSVPDVGAFEGDYATGFADAAAPKVVIAPYEGSIAADIPVFITDNVETGSNLIATLWYRLGSSGPFAPLQPNVTPTGATNGIYRWNTSLQALPAGTYQYYVVVRDAAGNFYASPTMTPGATSPGFTAYGTDSVGWAGTNPFANAGVRTFQVGTPLAGATYSVGTGGTYANLTAVAAEISAKPLAGNVIFELTTNYTSATETFPIVFNQPAYSGTGGPYTITIRPAADVTTELVTAGNPGGSRALIILDGAQRMTFDGRPGGVGTSRMWRITNSKDSAATNVCGEAILLVNDAAGNTLRYLTIESNTSANTGGVIGIGSTFFGGYGNSNNVIANCVIRNNAAATVASPPNPIRGISAIGGTNILNRNNVYANNWISNFHSVTSNPIGIALSGEVGSTVTGNSFYQTAPRTGTIPLTLAITVGLAAGPGMTITDNYIGGSEPFCGGSPYTHTSSGSTASGFYGMQINVGGFTTPTTISGNVITNMNITTWNATASSVMFAGINLTGSTNQVPVYVRNNVIGSSSVDATTNPAIIFASRRAAPSIFAGYFASQGGTMEIVGNSVGGVRLVTDSAGTASFIGIQQQTAGIGVRLDSNLIGSLTTPNNIVQNTNAGVSGIVHLLNANSSMSYNTIANALFNAGVAGSSQAFTGISATGSGNAIILGNTIRNIVGNNHGGLTGISVGASGLGTRIERNTIRDFNVTPQTPSTAIIMMGLSISSSTSTGQVIGNTIYNLMNGSTAASAVLRGIYNGYGTRWVYANNMISLGAGVNGDIIIYGIHDWSDGAGGGFYYYNSVLISGSVPAGSVNTAAFYRQTTSTPMTLRNNLFINNRIGPASPHRHFAVINPNATGWTSTSSDYNVFYTTSDTVAQWLGTNSAASRTLAGWQTSSGGDANTIAGDPGFMSVNDLHISPASSIPSNNGTPIAEITTDFDGDPRSATTPDRGADEYVGAAPGAFALLTPANNQPDVPKNGTLTWESSQYAASYDVYLDKWTGSNLPTTLIGNVTGTSMGYSVAARDSFIWRVVAKNGNGTTACNQDFVFFTAAEPPAAPTSLAFTRVVTDSVYMTWTDNATNEEGFRVYRATALLGTYANVSGNLDSLAGTGLTGSFNDGGLSPNVKYYYKVAAFHSVQGESDPALDSAITLANIPAEPTFANIGYTAVNVIVNENGNSAATEFAIRVAGLGFVQANGTIGPSEVWRTKAQWGGASGIRVTGLTVSTSYNFDVKARNLNGIETAYGPVGNVTTLSPLSLPFVEDFTSTTYPPTGWSRRGTVIGSRQTAVQPNGTSGGALRFYFYGVQSGSDTLITPLIDMTSTGTIVLRFSHAYRQYTTENDRFRVLLSTNDGATWDTTLFDRQGAALATLPASTSSFTPSAASDWRNNLIIIPVSRYSNTTRLMLIATSQYGNNLWIDDIKLESMKTVDYALTSIRMVNGIPSPFMLRTDNPGEKYAETEILSEKNGVPSSNVNNSEMIYSNKPYEGKLQAYANDKNLTSLSGIEGRRPLTMRFEVSNLGIDTTATFTLNWDIAGTSYTPYTSTTGVSFNGKVNVDLTETYPNLGTYTTNASITVPGDEDLTNNSLSFHRTLVYPEPMVRIRYDNGDNIPNTFIGANGPPFLAGVRFTTTTAMKLTNVDAYFRNETSTAPIEVRIYAAGATNNAPGALLYTQTFTGVNYSSATGDYFTLPLGPSAPSFAANTSFWVAIRFADVPYPMGAHNSGFTAGRSFYSLDEGSTWSPLVITTERAWLLRTVGEPLSPPSAATLIEPADQSFITVHQSMTDSIRFRWTASIDPDNDPVSYFTVVSLVSNFATMDTVYSGLDTSFFVQKNVIDSWLASKGKVPGDTTTVYWKVISNDGMFTVHSSPFSARIYRWKFTPTPGWVSQTSGTIQDLYSVKAVSQTVAWAVGASGVVRATINGGINWVDRSGNAPWGTEDLYHVFAVDENTAFVIADPMDGAYIYKTTNGGTSWYQVFYQAGGFLNALYLNGPNGYGVGDPVGGKWTVIQTTDGGESWFRMATEPTAPSGTPYGYNNSFSLIGNNMWFGTNVSRVYYSTNLGLTWNFAPTTFTNTYDIQFNTLTNGIVAGNGIARTLNGGAGYTNITTVPGTGNFGAMGGAGNVDFWASRAQVINRTKNTGDTWAIEFTMPQAVYAMDFATYVDGATTYTSGWAVTAGGSIAAFFDTTTTVNVNDPTDVIPTAFALYPNYPNPFNPTTAIRYDLKENAKVTLKIYNSLGQEVRTLVNTAQNAGSYTIHWDGKNDAGVQVASGVYIYRIQAGNFVKSHKMMLLK